MQLIEINNGLESMRDYYEAMGEFGSLGYGLTMLKTEAPARLLAIRGYHPFLCFVSSGVCLGTISGIVTWARWKLYSDDRPLDLVEFTARNENHLERFPGWVDLPNLCWADYLGFSARNTMKNRGK